MSSTARGGGVSELLSTVLGYLVGAGLRTRWLVIDGDEAFFEVTKRIHHRLHGFEGDGGALGEAERLVYEKALSAELAPLMDLIDPGDLVVLNDPQTLGLAPGLAGNGLPVIWSCHIGADAPSPQTRDAWAFLHDYVTSTAAQVFSRPQYAWPGLDPARVSVIPPCLDPFSPKNQPLSEVAVASGLERAGLGEISGEQLGPATFDRQDGTVGQISTPASLHQEARIGSGTPIVTQISRWDPLKDHLGLLESFTEHVPVSLPAHLVLAGPMPSSVDDDPEDEETFSSVLGAWKQLPFEQRARTHIVALPMGDPEENAAMVNALQRRSAVVVQKSLAEGFGLTVAEAMVKGRPVVAARVGGIQDQISHLASGLLVDDPSDLSGFGHAVSQLLLDDDLGRRLGETGVRRVVDEYIPPVYLDRYLRLVDQVAC
jgi:trehalose synthase